MKPKLIFLGALASASLPVSAALVHDPSIEVNTLVSINPDNVLLTEEIGNASLSDFNTVPGVHVLSYETTESFDPPVGQADPSVSLPSLGITVTVNNSVDGFNVLTSSAAFASSGVGTVASKSNQMFIDFSTPVAAVGTMIIRNQVSQTITVKRTGLADETFTLLENSETNHSFFGFTSDQANITQVIFDQGTEDNQRHLDDIAFSFTPVPEPSSLVLIGTGAFLIGCRRRRNQR